MPDVYYIEGVTWGCGDPISFEIRWNGARMIVSLDQNPSPEAVENVLSERHADACSSRDMDLVDQVQDEILDAIVEAGEALFDKLAPSGKVASPDLHAALFPPEYSFRLVTIRDTLQILIEGTYRLKAYAPPKLGFEDVFVTSDVESLEPAISTPLFELDVKNSLLPKYVTTAIDHVQSLQGSGHVSHVAVNGSAMCAKVGRRFDRVSMQRELNCLAKITAHAADSTMRINIPKLLGLIELPKNGKVIGILEELIPARESQELTTLAFVDEMGAIAKPRREAWAKQIQQTVSWMHSIGVTWGDGKPDNVLIHPETDEAWVVDFGAGWTNGWVDKELAGTIEGDDQAVRKIVEFLQVSSLRDLADHGWAAAKRAAKFA